MRILPAKPRETGIVFREDFCCPKAVTDNGGVVAGTPTIANGLTVTVANTQGVVYENTRTLLNGATKATFKVKWYQVLAADYNYLFSKYDAGGAVAFIAITNATSFSVYESSLGIYQTFNVAADTLYDLRIVYDGTQAAANDRIKIWNMATGTPVSVALVYTGTIPTSLGKTPSKFILCGYENGATPAYIGRVGTILYHVSIIQGLAWSTAEMLDDYNSATHATQTYEEIKPNKAAVWLPLNGGGYADPLTVSSTELLVDGNMEAVGVGSWPVVNILAFKVGSAHSGAQCLRLFFDGVNALGYAWQGPMTAGKTYHLTGWARGDGTSVPMVYSGSGGTYYWQGTSSTSWQYFDVSFPAALYYVCLMGATLSAGHYVEFDDCSLTETTNRLSDGSMETTGVDRWTSVNAAVLTKQTGTPHGGTQCLRVATGTLGTSAARQTILTIGYTYHVQGWARGDGACIPAIANSATVLWTGTSSTSWQYFDFKFVASATGLDFYITTAGTYTEWDDITVQLQTDQTGNLGTVGSVVIGDGVTATTFPAQISPCGRLFDGGDSIRIPNYKAGTPTTSITVGCMVRFKDATTYQGFIDQISSAGGWKGYGVVCDNTAGSQKVQLYIGTAGITSSKVVGDGAWHSIICTYDTVTTIGSIYIDGMPDGAASMVNALAGSSADVWIGGGAPLGFDSSFRGSMSTPFIFHNFLATATQARALDAEMRRLRVIP